MSADNMARQSQGLVDIPENVNPGTSTPFGINNNSAYGLPGASKGGAMSNANLPSIVSDENVYRLTDLINADFKMPVTDKDFELSHE